MFKTINLNKEEKIAMRTETRKASIAALKNYFTGNDSTKNISQFLTRFVLYTFAWSIISFSLIVTGLVLALFVAPGHIHILTGVRTIFLKHSVDSIDRVVVYWLMSITRQTVTIGAFVALILSLLPIVSGPQKEIMDRWMAISDGRRSEIKTLD